MSAALFRRFAVAGVLAASLLSSYPGSVSAALSLKGGGPALTASIQNVTITSFDGTSIAMTVFIPAVPANTPVPLVVHANPWGGSRMTSLNSQGLIDLITYTDSEAAVALANNNGYFAISYDERGWGQSGGTDELMSAAYEGKDFEAVLNWADQNLGPQLARTTDGKMVAATLGYSYGGGFQMLGASLDSRVRVMVPALSWHYLVESLGPGSPSFQPKTQWVNLLVLAGQVMGKSMNPVLLSAKTAVNQQGDAADYTQLFDLLGSNGPNAYCGDTSFTPASGQSVPRIPTFLIQGWYDSLFTANEGLQNAACLRAAGADVRLLVQQWGHAIPFTTPIPSVDGLIAVGMEKTPHCGTASFELATAMFSFIDENIFGASHYTSHVNVPTNCFTVDENTGFTFNSIPTKGSSYKVGSSIVPVNVSGTGNNASFKALYTATRSKALAGIPHMNVTVKLAPFTSTPPYAYFGLGVVRSGSTAVQLLDNQIYPIHGSGNFNVDMVGVAANLAKGDKVGIYASNSEALYQNQTADSQNPPSYSYYGTFTLPPFLN